MKKKKPVNTKIADIQEQIPELRKLSSLNTISKSGKKKKNDIKVSESQMVNNPKMKIN